MNLAVGWLFQCLVVAEDVLQRSVQEKVLQEVVRDRPPEIVSDSPPVIELGRPPVNDQDMVLVSLMD